MNDSELVSMDLLQRLITQTLIKPDSMEDYLLGRPGYFEASQTIRASPLARRLLVRTDFFEFELRQYLAEASKTRYHLNQSVRNFRAVDEDYARMMIYLSLAAVETTLLKNEWYEVMPRFKQVQRHIQETFLS